MDALIMGCVICGLGGAGMYFGSMALLTQMTSERERPLFLNLVGNLVVGGVCAPVYLFLLPVLNPHPGQTIKRRAGEIDYIGVVLPCGLILSIGMAISFGGVEYAWNSGRIIALFVIAFVLLSAFLAQQILSIGTSVDNHKFPVPFLMSSCSLIVLFLEIACAATCVLVPVYFLHLYFQFVRANSAILAAILMLPFMAFHTAIAILSGWLVAEPVTMFHGTYLRA
ncbi:conserved hypothetical protein [Talaromyces stipitatus ATCC 10500]|uniref:Uncharacterized protein n=1 Tax=Talaromyces stipitatus (strain ATCC 10500 / CBS 375.48 / QM 6759 / NRRL 1006) TaxID=441959 RepID=B8M212_TALSN|nr:uncharacterized protein TSTA_086210 [Talaromyces stipitatus ATCC 10500]EED21390.1 conserved hypothetical protein [Talaromyces stipitatus ATCC 10500]